MKRFLFRFLFPAGSPVPRGAFLSLREFSFQFAREGGQSLVGGPGERFVRVPLALVPLVLLGLAGAFMLWLPAVGVFGLAFWGPKALRRWFKGTAVLLLLLVPYALQAYQPSGPGAVEAANAGCFLCHASSLTHVKFADGEALNVRLAPETYMRADVHARVLRCVDCHVGYGPMKHPQITQFESRKQYRLARYELCRGCHPREYSNLTGSIHFELLRRGDGRAPVCTDCHSVHRMIAPKTSRRQVIATCRSCHEKTYDQYRNSVHGRALLAFDNPDVPRCVDCHGAHRVLDHRSVSQRVRTPEMCARCHSDRKLMGRYGLRADVYSTYLDDFHGVTVKFDRETGKFAGSGRIAAVCVDCHGIHNIRNVKDPSGSVDRTYVDDMCRRCHGTIPEGFSRAWLSHYRPSPARFPLVFLARAFYLFVIPFTIAGLGIHMVFHFGRNAWRLRRKHDRTE